MAARGRRWLTAGAAFTIIGFGGWLTGSPPARAEAKAGVHLVGFSFSPKAAAWLGLDPATALPQLLSRLDPDLVRLPVYWDDAVGPRGTLNFAAVDSMIEAVREHNARQAGRHTRVVLVVGARNIGYPEVHRPQGLPASTGQELLPSLQTPGYGEYLRAAAEHFAGDSLLYAWQLENEPFDNVPTIAATHDAIPARQLAAELALLRSRDPAHPVVVTSYDSATVDLDQRGAGRMSWVYSRLPGSRPAGHPLDALRAGDALGLDAYVATPSTPLTDAGTDQRIQWKREALQYWAERAAAAGKELWLTEVQGAPWSGAGPDSFTQTDLMASASAYSTTGARVILLWGVESWLLDPTWAAAGKAAVETLRTGKNPLEAARQALAARGDGERSFPLSHPRRGRAQGGCLLAALSSPRCWCPPGSASPCRPTSHHRRGR
jgi:hypothetical protein